jgi:L-iditol 2-dehydrogenase
MGKPKLMECAIFYGIDDLRLENRPIPKINETDVLVEVKACGICGTDFLRYKGKISYNPVLEGRIMGHEITGIIKDKGKNVKCHKIGDRVVISPFNYCGECCFCRKGNTNLCLNGNCIGEEIDGGYSKYVCASQKQVFALPDNLSFEEGTLLADPLPTIIYALRSKANINLGDNVCIWGMGAQGYSAIQLAKLNGGTVIAIGRNENKLKLAKVLGADFVIDIEKEDVIKKIKKITDLGADICIECGGYPLAMDQALRGVRKGGRLVMIGLQKPQICNFEDMLWNEKQLFTSFSSTPVDFITGIKLAQEKKIQLKQLITHVYDLSEISEAFNLISLRRDTVVKVIIKS